MFFEVIRHALDAVWGNLLFYVKNPCNKELLFLLSKLFHLIMQFEIARHEVVHLNLNLRCRRN